MNTPGIFSLFLAASLFAPFNTASARDADTYEVDKVYPSGVLHLRKGPGDHYPVIMELPHDAHWIIKRAPGSRANSWRKVVWGNHEGWVNSRYLELDPVRSKMLEEHRACIRQNAENAICCGYPRHPGADRAHRPEIETFSVINVPKGQSLNMREAPSSQTRAVGTIPHNAVGVVKFPRHKSGAWQKVRWNGRDGWVNDRYLRYDPVISAYRNAVRDICE